MHCFQILTSKTSNVSVSILQLCHTVCSKSFPASLYGVQSSPAASIKKTKEKIFHQLSKIKHDCYGCLVFSQLFCLLVCDHPMQKWTVSLVKVASEASKIDFVLLGRNSAFALDTVCHNYQWVDFARQNPKFYLKREIFGPELS